MKITDMVKKYGSAVAPALAAIGPSILSDANVFFVDSGATDASDSNDGFHGESWETPFATLNYAISRCTASQGDIILVAPGHAENLATATSLVFNIAGVTVIGLGKGSLIPTFSLITAATATVSITAADVTIKNVRFVSNRTDGITAGITVAATADGLTLEDIQIGETTSAKEFITGITIAALTDNVTIKNLEYVNAGSTDSLAAITLAGATDRFRLLDSYIIGNFETAAILASGAAGTNILIRDNIINNPDGSAGLGISLHATTTGAVVRNMVYGGKAGTTPAVAAGCLMAENYQTNTIAASGVLVPAADTIGT